MNIDFQSKILFSPLLTLLTHSLIRFSAALLRYFARNILLVLRPSLALVSDVGFRPQLLQDLPSLCETRLIIRQGKKERR